MENIIFGVVSLFSRLMTAWSDLMASFEKVLVGRYTRVAKVSEGAVAVVLWSVPLAFWVIVIRFVVKHW